MILQDACFCPDKVDIAPRGEQYGINIECRRHIRFLEKPIVSKMVPSEKNRFSSVPRGTLVYPKPSWTCKTSQCRASRKISFFTGALTFILELLFQITAGFLLDTSLPSISILKILILILVLILILILISILILKLILTGPLDALAAEAHQQARFRHRPVRPFSAWRCSLERALIFEIADVTLLSLGVASGYRLWHRQGGRAVAGPS